MFRRIIAYLALVTGLAALAAPANASVAEALSCEIGVSAYDGSDAGTAASTCERGHRPDTAEDRAESEAPARKLRRMVRPPVLFGVDRAHE